MSASAIRFFVALISVSFAKSAPPLPNLCRRSDPKFEECLLRYANELKKDLNQGLKLMQIPSLDPIIIQKILITQREGSVKLDLLMTNVHLFGLSHYNTSKFNVDIKKPRIYIELFVPYLILEADYKMEGQILALPINGIGPSHSNFTGVNITLNLNFNESVKHGVLYWNLNNSSFDLTMTGAKVQYDNLFNGNKKLGDMMNLFMTENWDSIFRELKPSLKIAISEIINDIVNRVFEKFSFDELFPE